MSAPDTNVRCPRCDTRWRHRESIGHCAGCHRSFVGGSAFDRHQRITDAGKSECLDPATLVRDTDGWHYFEPVEETPQMQGGSWWRLRQTDAQKAAHEAFVERIKTERAEVNR